MVREANGPVCYAAPGIQSAPAQALADLARRIGSGQLTVSLDFSERVLRMGYGEVTAIQTLRDAGIAVTHAPGLRSALVIVDGEGYIFAPTALYLEAEPTSARNALRLSPEQVTDAVAHLSPAATAISDDQFKQVGKNLEDAPPVKFDLARQVHVYEPYLQYVHLKLVGAAIQRRRVDITPVLKKLDLRATKDIEGRLRTTFDLINKDSDLSSQSLDEDLRKIRSAFTRSLGADDDRVILKRDKPLLEESLEEFREKLEAHKNGVAERLQKEIDESCRQVAEYLLPLVLEGPPLDLRVQYRNGKSKEENAREWLDPELAKLFRPAQVLTGNMSLEVRFKDVTFETLNSDDFLQQVKAAFPDVGWDQAHEEFIAAGPSNSNKTGE